MEERQYQNAVSAGGCLACLAIIMAWYKAPKMHHSRSKLGGHQCDHIRYLPEVTWMCDPLYTCTYLYIHTYIHIYCYLYASKYLSIHLSIYLSEAIYRSRAGPGALARSGSTACAGPPPPGTAGAPSRDSGSP